MSQYHYSSLSSEPDRIRLLCLRPHENGKAGIQCELFEYSLQDSGKETHLYEALSYTWGCSDKPRSISINSRNFPITENLYAALLHLQDCSFERILWIDAICINQENLEERGQQVQLMAQIYSKAARVLVWLGEATPDSDAVPGSGAALEMIRIAAEDEFTNILYDRATKIAILALLGRSWFQRIWVLQEVAAARHILIMCGSAVIDGYTFYLGINRFYNAHRDSESSIRPITNLIKGAIFRPKYAISSSSLVSLNIRPLSELLDMFRTHQASIPVDKVYALLGMSSDEPSIAGIRPDYKVPWGKLFKDLVAFILSKDVSVETSNHSLRAVIKSKGYVLGQVSFVRSDERHNVNIAFKNAAWNLSEKTEWTLEASAESIREQDIVCLLQGASKPTIIRLHKDHFTIVVIGATPLNKSGGLRKSESPKSIHFPRDFLLVWDLGKSLGEPQGQEDTNTLTNANCELPEHSVTYLERRLEKPTRTWNISLILGDVKEYGVAEGMLREAIKGYEMAIEEEYPRTLKSQYGLTPLSWAAGNGYDTVANLLLTRDSVDPDLKDSQYGQTPLSWAAEHGNEVIIKLLLDTGKVTVDSKDNSSRTPLSRASEHGHDAIVKLLLDKDEVEADSKDDNGRTPLSYAAEHGNEAVLKLLLDIGKVDVDSNDKNGQTPLSKAAAYGHEAVVKLLLDTGKVDVERMDKDGRTLLWKAAANGHEDIVKLLLHTGKVDLERMDKHGQTLLSKAAANGHEAVVKLLLDTGKVKVERMDKDGRTLLWKAAANGREDIVKLLLDTGKADLERMDRHGQTLLSKAAANGREAIVKLLLDTNKVNGNSKDRSGWTPLFWAAAHGHKAIVKLLLDIGKVEADAKNNIGLTPLWWATINGHKAIVEVLLNIDIVKADFKDDDSRTPLSRASEHGHDAIVKLLLDTGKVEADSKDDNGRTPLSYAAEHGNEAVVKLLLETGKVKVDSTHKYGRAPISWAVEGGHDGVVRLLLEASVKPTSTRD